MTYARHLWPYNSECFLACHTCCDTGHPFIMVMSEDPWHSQHQQNFKKLCNLEKYIPKALSLRTDSNIWTFKPISLSECLTYFPYFQFSSIEWPRPFPRGENYEKAEIYWQILKFFFSRTTGPISSKLGTKHSWLIGIKACTIEGPYLFPRGDNYEIWKIHSRIFNKKILQNQPADFNQT